VNDHGVLFCGSHDHDHEAHVYLYGHESSLRHGYGGVREHAHGYGCAHGYVPYHHADGDGHAHGYGHGRVCDCAWFPLHFSFLLKFKINKNFCVSECDNGVCIFISIIALRMKINFKFEL